MAYNNSISNTSIASQVSRASIASAPTLPATSGYQQAFPLAEEPRGPVNVTLPVNLLGNMEIPTTGYLIDHTMPQENIIRRYVPNALFDSTDIDDNGSVEIYELLPKAPTYPDTIPLNLDLYVANWSRVINFGGVTDPAKDPRIDNTTEWSIAQWTERHKWPEVATLDPTYVFFTQDPALFYTQRVISHYEPDTSGQLQPVMVADDDMVWKLDGNEVHRGWYMNLSALSRTVEVRNGEAVVIPRILSVEAQNSEGILRKEIKFAAIDSDQGDAIPGSSQVDNFSSTFEGQFIADEDPASEDYRSAIFWPDPRYGARDVYFRFLFRGYGSGKSKRKKFRKTDGVLIIDGVTHSSINGAQIQDKWQRKDFKNKNHQDALSAFPDAFNDDGRLKQGYRDNDGSKLALLNVTNWTDGRKSAILMDEVDQWNSRLYKIQKKPGPFSLKMSIGFNVRGKYNGKRGKYKRYWEQSISYNEEQLNLDTPLQPIDLGIFNIGYRHK